MLLGYLAYEHHSLEDYMNVDMIRQLGKYPRYHHLHNSLLHIQLDDTNSLHGCLQVECLILP